MPTRADLELDKRTRALPILLVMALVTALGWTLSGCGGSFGGGDPGLIGDLTKGERAYDKGHYRDAVLHLERFRETQPGSRFMDKALYLLGKSHQGLGEFLLAEDAFRQLVTDYPTGEFAQEGTFELPMSAFRMSKGPDWTQVATEEAIIGFRQYLARYPDGKYVQESEEALRTLEGRLAMKACKNAELYLTLRKPEAAKIYFEKGLGYREDVEAVPRCHRGLIRALEALDDIQGALDAAKRLEEWLTVHGDNVLAPEEKEESLGKARTEIQRLERLVQENHSSMSLTGGD